jgi:hypothetical protein
LSRILNVNTNAKLLFDHFLNLGSSIFCCRHYVRTNRG